MEKLRFVVSLITDDNDYQREQASAAQEAATRLESTCGRSLPRTMPFIRVSNCWM